MRGYNTEWAECQPRDLGSGNIFRRNPERASIDHRKTVAIIEPEAQVLANRQGNRPNSQ